jgi:hypothetical protein
VTRDPDDLSESARAEWAGRSVVDAAGTTIGPAVGMFVDERAESVDFVAVRVGRRAGLKRRRVVLVPLADAVVGRTSIQVMCGQKLAARAPGLPGDHGLDCDGEREVFEHYGLRYPGGDESVRLHSVATAHD